MNYIKTSSIVFAIILVGLIAFSPQSAAAESFPDHWAGFYGTASVQSRRNIHFESQYRMNQPAARTSALLLRIGFGQSLRENNHNLLIGYGFIYAEQAEDSFGSDMITREHRIFQQYIYRHGSGRYAFLHRLRTENRFLNHTLSHRFRYFLMSTISLNKREYGDGSFYLSNYAELFLNLKSTPFDRYRLYGGLGYRISKKIRAELGLLNQTSSTASWNMMNVMVFLTL